MLNPEKDRIDYGAILSPPEGYVLDKAIATTYSLDLNVLISIPVALCFSKSLEFDTTKNSIAILDSIRRISDSVKIYCQAGQIKVPENHNWLYSLMEKCIVQIPPTKTQSFHPKIWILRYLDGNKSAAYRIIVLSRNMTFDDSWDVAFKLDGVCKPNRSSNVAKNKPLIELLEWLYDYENTSWLKSFIRDFAKTEFICTEGSFEDFQFIVAGIDKNKSVKLFSSGEFDEVLIISPFLSNQTLRIAENSSRTIPRLFTRESELRGLDSELLKLFEVYHLSDDFQKGDQYLDTEGSGSVTLQDLHAKVYAIRSGRQASLTLGSANCTHRGFDSNVEVLLRLNGAASKMGPSIIFEELMDQGIGVFVRFQGAPKYSDEELKTLNTEKALHEVKIEMVNVSIKGNVTKNADGNYCMDLRYDLQNLTFGDNVKIKLRLLNASEQPKDLKWGLINNLEFVNIREIDLSCFVVITIVIGDVKNEFLLKISVSNLPTSRGTLIFSEMIMNPKTFLKYIRFLLMESEILEDVELAYADGARQIAVQNQDADLFFLTSSEALYESLLKAKSRNPEKLNQIKELINKLKGEGGRADIIPEHFQSLWDVIEDS
jgi:hypothetical protein